MLAWALYSATSRRSKAPNTVTPVTANTLVEGGWAMITAWMSGWSKSNLTKISFEQDGAILLRPVRAHLSVGSALLQVPTRC